MDRSLMGALKNQEKGQSLIEFAILAPIFIILLTAMIDFGRVFDAWIVTTNAAREGARYAAIYSTKDYLTDTQIVQLSKQKAYDYLLSGLGTRRDVSYSIDNITVSVPPVRWAEPITVDVPVQVQIWALLNVFLSNQATIRGSATMRT